ncbi:LysM domain-containing protein [Promicromonospora umidemergens]|uniref:LysM domain-containing protein n=2 Tax=Promicromonospora TaxID=43676 RepID=A0ABP8XL67_9MICO|nr:LysM peptidoglycan-binding domain-containing protein [Promicromonospora umidemergens]MCP2284965.1 LysM domain-containing protein [Promicromonospora umidemergens]
MTRTTNHQLPVYSATRPGEPPARVTAADRLRGLGAMLCVLLLVVGLPAGLLAARPLVLPAWLDLETARIVLLGGDVSRVLLLLGYAVAWLIWAWLTWKVLVEVARQTRQLHRPHLAPVPVGLVGRLVATMSMLVVSLPLNPALAAPSAAVGVAPAPDAAVGPATERAPGRTADTVDGSPNSDAPAASARTKGHAGDEAVSRPEARVVSYVVRRGDTLWGLAESRFGDGRRYTEIHDLNRDTLGPNPGLLPAGATILLPDSTPDTRDDEAEGTDSAKHTVRPGETLTGIARDHYGDPARYTTIAQASKDTVQPGGEHLTDPDHIKPGWILTLPGSRAAEPETDFAAHKELPSQGAHPTQPKPTRNASGEPAPVPRPDADNDDQAEDRPAVPGPTGSRADSPWVTPTPQVDDQGSNEDDDETGQAEGSSQDAEDEASAWLLPGVAAGGAILAAGLHVTVTRARSRRERLRRPGRMVAPTPPDLVPAVATARFVGGDRVSDVQRLDRLLRALAGPHLVSGLPRPQLAAVELTADQAVLHLTAPATLPEPWTGDGTRWATPLAAAPQECRDLVPYPVLVTVGVDQDGHAWLLDLEHLRTVAVTGDDENVIAFGRHLVAELAVNPWTVNLTTHAAGIGHGAAGLSQYRVEEDEDTAFLDPITTYVRHSASETPGEDHEWFHAVVTTKPSDELSALGTAIHAHPGRASAVVITLGVEPRPDDVVLAMLDGRLRIELPDAGLDLDLVPARISGEELAACARLVEVTRDPSDVANPLADTITGRAIADDATAPTVQVTERPDDPDTAAGPWSILPGTDVEYITRTANTREDLSRLAPVVQPADARPDGEGLSRVGDEVARHDQADMDAALDQDLADWWNQDTDRPRIEVLGAVSMWGAGPAITDPTPTVRKAIKAVTERESMFTHLAAFIALHPRGVTLEQVELVTGAVSNDVRYRITSLRHYLGTRPDGTSRIPHGKAGRPKADDPPHLYRIENALVDAHLFRRLYQRAIRRGADGLPDLVTALELVGGRPFTLAKDDPRWLWAAESEGLADQYTALIGDVAHLVVTRAILDGDLALARRACETWRACDPASEALAADDRLTTLAEGHPDQARQIAAELWTRNDDETGPTGPSERTQRITEAHDGYAAERVEATARPDEK